MKIKTILCDCGSRMTVVGESLAVCQNPHCSKRGIQFKLQQVVQPKKFRVELLAS